MAIPNAPHVCKVTMVFARDSRTFINTFHLHDSGDWTLEDLTVFAPMFVDWWNDTYRLAVTNKVSLTQIQMRVLDPVTPLAYDLPVSPPIAGFNSGDVLPGNVTSTISWRSGLAGKKYRGRTYVPGYAEATVGDDDKLGSTAVSLLAAAAEDFITRFTIDTVVPIIFHALTNDGTTILTYVIEAIVDSMRSRLPARGR